MRHWCSRVGLLLVGALVVALVGAATTTVWAGQYTYDAPHVAHAGTHAPSVADVRRGPLGNARQGRARPDAEVRGTSTTSLSRSVATNTVSPWSLGPSPRGLAIEEALGGSLPRSFPTIDSFANGTATSIKSIDLTASSYQSAGRLTSRLNGYVDGVAGFDGAVFDGVRIAPGATTARELVVAVQPGVASSAQQAALAEVVQYGASNGVTVRVVPVP
jgi:hypothetical protein